MVRRLEANTGKNAGRGLSQLEGDVEDAGYGTSFL
jgi:hypothetical protein